MISKAAILERANEWQLTPEVVEKDYLLGWLLAGIGLGGELGRTWVFKGGTCLKKCVLETYTFSEDLDFTLLPDARYTAEEIAALLRDLSTRVSEQSGIQFPATAITVRPRGDQWGQPTFEARIGYVGPVAIPGPPRILFDITRNEPLLRPAELRTVVHPYPDQLPVNAQVRCYSVGELVAEKPRALVERTRPRDLYDVVLLGSEMRSPADAAKLRALAIEKFAVKNLSLPAVAGVVMTANGSAELRSEWDNMLGHQLPATPSIEDFLEPYSLRRPSTGNLLLYGYEQTKDGIPTANIRADKVAEIEDFRATNQSFRPRYAIELSEQAGMWRW